ncbi:vWA domain-containing protein [Cohaesibacter haloalkalitolerans]|uniref:vWA domain-containing protein n=1 Tax=Cohaesibacter haloalkalitolerans TaxID=1162980 RepID=UPI000E64CAA3|nr:VWA domain-containing protein [Cohaesibacter haloalkalitolerans]
MTACELIVSHVSRLGWVATCQETGLVASLASWGVLLLVAGLLLLTLWRMLLRPAEGKGRWRGAVLSSGAVVLSALLLAVAAGRPAFLHRPTDGQQHFIFVVDQSESAHRQGAARAARLKALVEDVQALAEGREQATRVSVLDFAAGVDIRLNRGSLADGLAVILRDDRSERLSRDGSDLAGAIKAAEGLADQLGDDDVVFLISDGNSTGASLEAIAATMKGHLHRLYVTTLDAGAPAEGIVSSYLPASVQSGSDPTFRVVLDPGDPVQNGAQSKDWALALERDGAPVALEKSEIHGTGAIEALRLPVRFDGRGIHYAAVNLANGDQSFVTRAFTLVNAPVRVLGVGDTAFLDGLPPDQFQLTERKAGNLSGLEDFDVVVLGGVPASTFSGADLERLAGAVGSRGLGLLLVNGPMRGSAEDPTVVQSYADTPLDPLLPVSPDPRFLMDDPPPRDTIVLVDTSGSMSGGGLAAARSAVADLLGYLRPEDSLQLVTFGGLSSGRQFGTEDGKAAIRAFARRFPTGDSSNVTRAFETALASTGNYTSVFLITDGMVDPYDYAKAGLSFYYLQYGSGLAPLNEEIAKAARQSQILQSGQGLAFRPDSYQPEEKAEFFSPDPVHPRIVSPIEDIRGGIVTPGVAFSYARADAIRALVSDGIEGEPVLAFSQSRQAQSGRTGVFLSAFDAAWKDSEAGRKAIAASLLQLVKWSARSRYAFRLSDLGGQIGLQISVMEEKGASHLPQGLPQTLAATLAVGGRTIGIPLQPVSEDSGVFEGRLPLSLTEEGTGEDAREGAREGLLYLQEGGAGALDAPQAIPIMLPPARTIKGNGREAASFGVNRSGLEVLAGVSGGAVDHLPAPRQAGLQPVVPPQPLHLPLILLAAIFAGFGFLMRGNRL